MGRTFTAIIACLAAIDIVLLVYATLIVTGHAQ